MKAPIAMLGAILLGGCADKPQSLSDAFQTTGSQTFSWVVSATAIQPVDDPQGEHARRARLERHLRDHGLCPNGYEIVSRDPPLGLGRVQRSENPYALRNVTYSGRCLG